jgi:hypothetical protein
MKRDMELAKQILEQMEAFPEPRGVIPLNFPDRTTDEVFYHVKLLSQAGLIDARESSDSHQFRWKPLSLTYHGHEFLDAIRNDKVWAKVKEKAKEQGGALPFEVLKALAIQIAKGLFGLG